VELLAIVTALALLEYMVFSFQVGFAREKSGVAAPKTTGDETFERLYRVQHNTLEQLIIFLPALWMFGNFWSPAVAAGIGCVFLIGRPLYARAYVVEPSGRTLGFVLGFLANVVLVLGALIGAAMQALATLG
jgi:uncharacterized membrane protein YecN with MAPEG domain